MSNGQVCPTCRDRLLDSIPGALPSQVAREGAHLHLEADASRESHHDLDARPWPPPGFGPH